MRKMVEKVRYGSPSNQVTKREKANREIARRAAAESFVLLRNEEEVLPLKKGSRIGLYGAGAVKTIKGGTGSGDVNERDSVSIWEGLKKAGFKITSTEWLESYDEIYRKAREDWKAEIFRRMEEDPKYDHFFFNAYSSTQFALPAGAPIDEEQAECDDADTAIFVLSRIAGENRDRQPEPGDYYISDEELELLTTVSEYYENVILVLNTGGLVDLAFLEEFDNITGIIQYVQAGMEGGNALADVLLGKVSPSGKLADTWAKSYEDYPNAAYFSSASGDCEIEEYREGIFVGYRYFDTFQKPVLFPFGFGLSYTTFKREVESMDFSGIGTDSVKLNVTVKVTNTGNRKGKEVVELYASCPQGRLVKEFRRLIGFAKTKELSPKESVRMMISVDLDACASYDEKKSAWILEAGRYGIWAGNSLKNAKLAGSFILDQEKTLLQCETICPVEHPFELIKPDPEKLAARSEKWEMEALSLPETVLKAAELPTKTVEYRGMRIDEGEAGDLTKSLSVDELISLATGNPSADQNGALGSAGQMVPGSAAETVDIPEKNIGSMVLSDGPAGLRLKQTYNVYDGVLYAGDFLDAIEHGFFAEPKKYPGEKFYQYCTAIPVGTNLAQTWNLDLMKEIGEMIGGEMELFHTTLWLAPGMCIHRNPLCGRNFEYYSEDPLLTGLMGASITKGVQKHPGIGTTIKHFACNNQEDNRMGSDSRLSERTLREIYLRGFEIAVRTAQPMSIMTSYNMVNGVHSANNYDLCTKAARDEWGFAGAIMTDWTTTTDSTRGICTASGCMRAGNDMVMPGDARDHENLRAELAAGTLSEDTLRACVSNTLRITLQSHAYEDSVSYTKQFGELDPYVSAVELKK